MVASCRVGVLVGVDETGGEEQRESMHLNFNHVVSSLMSVEGFE